MPCRAYGHRLWRDLQLGGALRQMTDRAMQSVAFFVWVVQ